MFQHVSQCEHCIRHTVTLYDKFFGNAIILIYEKYVRSCYYSLEAPDALRQWVAHEG